jgi:hypothetical protein
VAASRIAAAEWHFTPLIGFTFAGKTTLVDPQKAAGKRHVNFGGAVSRFGAGVLGAEAIVVFTPGFFQTDESGFLDVRPPDVTSSHTLAIMGNLILTTPQRWTEYSLRPFVSGGFGMLRASFTVPSGQEVFPLHESLAAFDIGGGAVGFFSKRTGVRFDLRYYSTVHDTPTELAIGNIARLHYMTATVGLVFRR